MIFTETRLRGAFIVDVEPRADERGFFARTFCQDEFRQQGLDTVVAQTALAFNKKAGTVRGLHFQYPPAAEPKLIRCTRGGIIDVIVDLRPESETFLQYLTLDLNEHNRRAVYVPKRFAHGYQTVSDDTELAYQMSEFYKPNNEDGLRYDDPALGVPWPLPVSVISERDRNFASLADRGDELRRRLAE